MIDVVRFGPGEAPARGTVKKTDTRIGSPTLPCIDSPVKHGCAFSKAFSLFVERESEEQINPPAVGLSEGGAAFMPPGEYGLSR